MKEKEVSNAEQTALTKLIRWTIENAFNLTGQDGTKYIAIDHEEMREHFEHWLKLERCQIQDAFDVGQANWEKNFRDVATGSEYFSINYTQNPEPTPPQS